MGAPAAADPLAWAGRFDAGTDQETAMGKGNKVRKKEVKKPKQDKAKKAAKK